MMDTNKVLRGSGWNIPLWNRTSLQNPYTFSVVIYSIINRRSEFFAPCSMNVAHAPTLPVCTDIRGAVTILVKFRASYAIEGGKYDI